MTIYVSMIDTFMSGWGEAQGENNLHVIECETLDQAEAVLKAAKDRKETEYVSVSTKFPNKRVNRYVRLTQSNFNDLGKVWKKHYRKDHDPA